MSVEENNPNGTPDSPLLGNLHRPSLAIEEEFDLAQLREEVPNTHEVSINQPETTDLQQEQNPQPEVAVNNTETTVQEQEPTSSTGNTAEEQNAVNETNPTKSNITETVPKKEAQVPEPSVTDSNKSLATDTGKENEQEETEIKFSIKTPGGKVFRLKLAPDSTVEEVKESLAKMSEQTLEVKEMRLIFRGKPLNDATKTIQQIGIMNDAKIFLIKQLGGVTDNKGSGPQIQKSAAGERGFLTITIPQGARPGNRLIIHPPERQRMVVYVPRGMGPGDTLRIQLPNEPGTNPANTASNNRTAQNPAVPNQQAMRAAHITSSTVLKAICPPNASAGQEVKVNIAGLGLFKVAIPATARPGHPFYFRMPPM